MVKYIGNRRWSHHIDQGSPLQQMQIIGTNLVKIYY